MCTCGRHTLLERAVRFFLDQDYAGDSMLLIYNNSPVDQILQYNAMKYSVCGVNTGDQTIVLVNNHRDKITREPYTNLGAIYRDALSEVPEDVEVIIHWDDDDIFLPNHITAGVEGLKAALIGNKKAYKPARSYYRHPGGLQLMSNTLEPSIFVTAAHLRECGYHDSTSDQHLKWVDPLVYGNEILVDELGTPTLVYNWGDTDIPTFKTSGNAGDINNFQNYRNFSQDHGDFCITPWSKEQVQKYYDLVYAKQSM
jgi:hypothetical protein